MVRAKRYLKRFIQNEKRGTLYFDSESDNKAGSHDAYEDFKIGDVFAYNAAFDRNHLPELKHFSWYDIMRLAAYRQHNPKIPACADCCATGRLKRGYGVEPMLRLLSDNRSYHETHNAIYDAMDELEIMKLLHHNLSAYIPL